MTIVAISYRKVSSYGIDPRGNNVKYIYMLYMENMPKKPTQYFRTAVLKEKSGWKWVSKEKAKRVNSSGHDEWCSFIEKKRVTPRR